MAYLKDLAIGEVYKMTYGSKLYITQCNGRDDGYKDSLIEKLGVQIIPIIVVTIIGY